jgi:alpha-D-ribose 1-methylphosphonate 5-triphosphate diphosphatase
MAAPFLDPILAMHHDSAMTQETILANARVVLPDCVVPARVRVAGGRIVAVEDGCAVPPGAEDLGGDLLAPGFVELHTDNLERHIEPRPGVEWPHAGAIIAHDSELASCGVTTVFDALRVGSALTTGRLRYRKYARGLASELLALRAAGALRIDHRLHLRAEICSETLPDELAEFGPADGVGLISLMDHTPGQRQFRDVSKLKDYVCGKHGLSEAEFAEHVAARQALHAQVGAAHEAAAVAAAGRLGATLASHDDTTAAQVAASAAHRVRLAEFPTTVEAAEACRAHRIAVMMGGPNLVRGGSHSGNVAAANLARRGLLDILSSDYVPSALLTGAFRLAALWGDVARAVATVTATPAAAAGLSDRGRIAPGLRADLVRIATVSGHPVVRGTWVEGRRV